MENDKEYLKFLEWLCERVPGFEHYPHTAQYYTVVYNYFNKENHG